MATRARYLTNAPVLVKEPRRSCRHAASGGAEDGRGTADRLRLGDLDRRRSGRHISGLSLPDADSNRAARRRRAVPVVADPTDAGLAGDGRGPRHGALPDLALEATPSVPGGVEGGLSLGADVRLARPGAASPRSRL